MSGKMVPGSQHKKREGKFWEDGKMSLSRWYGSEELKSMKTEVPFVPPRTESISRENALAWMRHLLARFETQRWGAMAWVEGIWGRLAGEGAGEDRHRGRHFAGASSDCVSHDKILAVISVMWEAIEGICAQEWHNLIYVLKGLFWVPCWK